jgi:hypothetical protein
MNNSHGPQFRSYGNDLSLVKDDRLKALYTYWVTLHTGPALPSRRQIDPLRFPEGLIGYVSLFNVIDDGNSGYRMIFRIAGSISYGHNVILKNVSGRELHEVLTPEEASMVVGDFLLVIKTRSPVAATGVSFPFKHGPKPWEAIALPLSSNGEMVDALLTARVPITE